MPLEFVPLSVFDCRAGVELLLLRWRQSREMFAGHRELNRARDLDDARVLLDALDLEH